MVHIQLHNCADTFNLRIMLMYHVNELWMCRSSSLQAHNICFLIYATRGIRVFFFFNSDLRPFKKREKTQNSGVSHLFNKVRIFHSVTSVSKGQAHTWEKKKRASDINISTIRPSSLWCLSHIAYRIAWSVLVTLLGKKMHLLAPTFINVTVKHIYRLQRICPRPVARWESSQSILTSKIKQNYHTNFGKMVHSEVEPQIQRKTNYHFACLVSSDWLT